MAASSAGSTESEELQNAGQSSQSTPTTKGISYKYSVAFSEANRNAPRLKPKDICPAIAGLVSAEEVLMISKFKNTDFWTIVLNNEESYSRLVDKDVVINGLTYPLFDFISRLDSGSAKSMKREVLRFHRLRADHDYSSIKKQLIAAGFNIKGCGYEYLDVAGWKKTASGVFRIYIEYDSALEPRLNGFLGKQRSAYGNFIVTLAGAKPYCTRCKMTGHSNSRCSTVCEKCGAVGHTKANCGKVDTMADKINKNKDDSINQMLEDEVHEHEPFQEQQQNSIPSATSSPKPPGILSAQAIQEAAASSVNACESSKNHQPTPTQQTQILRQALQEIKNNSTVVPSTVGIAKVKPVADPQKASKSTPQLPPPPTPPQPFVPVKRCHSESPNDNNPSAKPGAGKPSQSNGSKKNRNKQGSGPKP
jgi:hypothetical protein